MGVQIKINDVTLREGDQAPLTSFNKDEKKIIALMLQELGVDNIEAGFAASRGDRENILGVFEVMDSDGPIVATLGRATSEDTEASLSVMKGYKNARIHIFLATSDEHIEAKFGSKGESLDEKRQWLLKQVVSEVSRAGKYKDTHNSQLEIEFSPEDATGNALSEKEDGKKYMDFKSEEFGFLVEVCETAIRNGATIINAPDTLGNLLPHETEAFFRELSERLQSMKNEGYEFELSAHIHNDLSVASANAISAIRGGATQIEVTINGIGERTGNTALHEIIGIVGEKGHAILDEGEVTVSPKIRPELIGPVSEFVRRILNLNLSLQKPFIGALSDIDGSGVHNASQEVYGGTKNKHTYGGVDMPNFFSPRGGVNQIIAMLQNFGLNISKGESVLSQLTLAACERAEIVKTLYECNVFALYMKKKRRFEVDTIRIDGNSIIARLVVDGKDVTISGEGQGENGFIDGLVSGINRYIGEDVIDVESLHIVNKPSLSGAYDRFEQDIGTLGYDVSSNFRKKVHKVISSHENGKMKSKQIGVAHVKLKVAGKEVSSASCAQDTNYAILKAIIDASLVPIMRKTIG